MVKNDLFQTKLWINSYFNINLVKKIIFLQVGKHIYVNFKTIVCFVGFSIKDIG